MTRVTSPIEAALLARVLQPYRANSRYLSDATLEHAAARTNPRPDDPATWIAIRSNCRIDASCYIDDTGHFNAVELNITYNQLLYAGLAAVARHGLIADLQHWDLETFFRHQLPDVLIIDYHARFPRPLAPRSFRSRFEIREVLPKPRKRMVLLRTYCAVDSPSVDGGPAGHADADVMIALVHV